MLHIAILGASGKVGTQLVAEALRRGHRVTAIARDVSKIAPRERLSAIAADATDPDALAKAVAGHDAVLSAMRFAGVPAATVIDAVKAAGVPRLLVVGGAGSLLLPDGSRVIDSPDFPDAYKAEASAGGAFLGALREASGLDWTFASPSAEFHDGPATGRFRLGKDHLLVDAQGRSHIGFADYATAFIDELERPAHSRARFTVGY